MSGDLVIRYTVQAILDELPAAAQRSLLLALQLGGKLEGKPFSEAISPLLEADGRMHDVTKEIVLSELKARLL